VSQWPSLRTPEDLERLSKWLSDLALHERGPDLFPYEGPDPA